MHQGCAFSSDLFHLYGENILRELGNNAGINMSGYNIRNFSYADNTTHVSENGENLQHLLNIIVNGSKDKCICINIKEQNA